MPCEFTHAHYKAICRLIMDHRYRPIFYADAQTAQEDERLIIVRHDVDQSLEAALQIAEIEHHQGIKSTFFVWLRAPFYNVFDPTQSQIIERLVALGHEIGLHFDETSYPIESKLEFGLAVAREVSVLSSFFGIPIHSVSMHRPSSSTIDKDIKLDGLINAYGQRFLREFRYVSDSRRSWREGCVCSMIENEQYPRIHLLTHSFWWTPEVIATVDSRVRKFLDDKLQYLDREVGRNISVYSGPSGMVVTE